MATPALRALRDAFPETHITAVVRPIVGELIQGAWGTDRPWFDDTLYVDKNIRSRLSLVKALRDQRLAAIVLLANSLWSAAVARLAGIQAIVGYDRDLRGRLLTHRLPVVTIRGRPQPISAINYYLELVHSIGCETRDRRMQLQVSAAERYLADRLWRDIQFLDDWPTVVINSNAARSTPRVWPADKVLALSKKIAHELGCQVLLHCGPSERDAADRIAAEAGHPKIASMGVANQLPIGLSKAVLAKATVVVSTDSGPRHMAIALERSVVSLFGPTDSAWTRTYNRPEQIVEQPFGQLQCRPCYQNKCPLQHHRCMQDISVDRVFKAVQRQMQIRSAAA